MFSASNEKNDCGYRDSSGRLGSLLYKLQAKEVLSVLLWERKRHVFWGRELEECFYCLCSLILCLPSVLVKDPILNPGIPEFGPESLEFTNDSVGVWASDQLWVKPNSSITNHLIAVVHNSILIKWLADVHSLPNRLDSLLASAVYSALFFWAFWVAQTFHLHLIEFPLLTALWCLLDYSGIDRHLLLL